MTEPKKTEGEWIGWYGGDLPVDRAALVTIRRRDGREVTKRASLFSWLHSQKRSDPSDIVAYCVEITPTPAHTPDTFGEEGGELRDKLIEMNVALERMQNVTGPVALPYSDWRKTVCKAASALSSPAPVVGIVGVPTEAMVEAAAKVLNVSALIDTHRSHHPYLGLARRAVEAALDAAPAIPSPAQVGDGDLFARVEEIERRALAVQSENGTARDYGRCVRRFHAAANPAAILELTAALRRTLLNREQGR